LFSEDAPSVAKETARPTLHQIAEWPEQTAGAPEVTKATKIEIRTRSNYFKKLGIFQQVQESDFLSSSNLLRFR
jgi:hypothetical protein